MNYLGIPYVGKLLSNFRGFYNEINSATLTGAIDVIVVEQEDGTYLASPFHVRFGKLGVLRSREKIVDIVVNGSPVDLHMKLGEAGEAFFVHEASEEDDIPSYLATSPLHSTADSLDLMEKGLKDLKQQCAKQEELLDITESTGNETEMTNPDVNISVITESLKSDAESATASVYVTVRHVGIQTQREVGPQVLDSPTESLYYSLDELPGEEEIQTMCRLAKVQCATVSVQTQSQNDLKRTNSRRKRRKHRRKSTEEDHKHSTSSSESEQIGVFEMEEEQQLLPNDEEVDKARMTEEWANSQFATDHHPWSDADLTPNISPVSSRPPSPKSDTEVETIRMENKLGSPEESYTWQWGEFPTPVQQEKEKGDDDAAASGSLFQFMRRTKKIRHQPEQEGLYLDDISENYMDPEVAQLYLYGRDRRGKERVQGVISSTAAVPVTKELMITTTGSEDESGRGASLPHSPVSLSSTSPPVSASVYRPIPHKPTFGQVSMSLCGGAVEDIDEQRFRQFQISYDDFSKEPTMFTNPKLVVSIEGKFYNWATAAPQLLSLAVYGQQLPAESLLSLEEGKKTGESKKETKRRGWGIWSWRGGESAETLETSKGEKSQSEKGSSPDVSKPTQQDTSAESIQADELLAACRKYAKSLQLTSDELKKLCLKKGQNHVKFSVTSRYQGTARAEAHIYLWRWNDKIIISDVDGTITRSDVLGQVLPLVGKDWSQEGITNLYNRISDNGYKFIYLSARAIGQSHQTRQMLSNVIQEKNLTLPEGPLLLTPNSLVQAFYREVIEKKPQEFKIGCLNNVKALFPENINPLCAGFGNKVTDVWAYQAVGIPVTRIFTVNHVGELRVECVSKFMSSYNKLYDIVDHFFPPLDSTHGIGQFNYEYSQFAYWRQPLPDIDEEAELMQKSMAESTKSTEAAKTSKKS